MNSEIIEEKQYIAYSREKKPDRLRCPQREPALVWLGEAKSKVVAT